MESTQNLESNLNWSWLNLLTDEQILDKKLLNIPLWTLQEIATKTNAYTQKDKEKLSSDLKSKLIWTWEQNDKLKNQRILSAVNLNLIIFYLEWKKINNLWIKIQH